MVDTRRGGSDWMVGLCMKFSSSRPGSSLKIWSDNHVFLHFVKVFWCKTSSASLLNQNQVTGFWHKPGTWFWFWHNQNQVTGWCQNQNQVPGHWLVRGRLHGFESLWTSLRSAAGRLFNLWASFFRGPMNIFPGLLVSVMDGCHLQMGLMKSLIIHLEHLHVFNGPHWDCPLVVLWLAPNLQFLLISDDHFSNISQSPRLLDVPLKWFAVLRP